MVWTTFHHRSSHESRECTKALCIHLSLFQTVSHADRIQGKMHRCFPQSAASTGWIWSQRSTSSSKTRLSALDISSLEFYSLLHSTIYSPVAVHVSHNGCRRFKTKPSTANKLYICQQTDHLSLSTTIFYRCQQTSSVAVNKLFNCCWSLNQSNSNKPSLQKGP